MRQGVNLLRRDLPGKRSARGLTYSVGGGQYGPLYANELKNNDIRISMDGKGRAIDNIFIERLWRSVKYEEVYLNPPKDGLHLYERLARYFHFYNHERLHQSLEYRPPARFYRAAA